MPSNRSTRVIVYLNSLAFEQLNNVDSRFHAPVQIGPFHLMSVPPLLRVNYKFYPLGKKRSKCRRIPPFRKRQMFSRDQRYRHSYPLRNDFKNPLPLPRISLTLNRGGADIKWNGPLLRIANYRSEI